MTDNAEKSGPIPVEQKVEDKLLDLAEDLGRLLGTAENRVTGWLGDRQAIATQLTRIRDTANTYLRELTAGGAALAAAVERGRRAGPTAPSADDKAEPTPVASKPGSES